GAPAVAARRACTSFAKPAGLWSMVVDSSPGPALVPERARVLPAKPENVRILIDAHEESTGDYRKPTVVLPRLVVERRGITSNATLSLMFSIVGIGFMLFVFSDTILSVP